VRQDLVAERDAVNVEAGVAGGVPALNLDVDAENPGLEKEVVPTKESVEPLSARSIKGFQPIR